MKKKGSFLELSAQISACMHNIAQCALQTGSELENKSVSHTGVPQSDRIPGTCQASEPLQEMDLTYSTE